MPTFRALLALYGSEIVCVTGLFILGLVMCNKDKRDGDDYITCRNMVGVGLAIVVCMLLLLDGFFEIRRRA